MTAGVLLVYSNKNRRQKAFNSVALRLYRMAWYLKFAKISTDLLCFIFQFEVLGALFGGVGGVKPTEASPRPRDWFQPSVPEPSVQLFECLNPVAS